MKVDPQKHHRRSIRLKGFDYRRPALYFVTLVTHERAAFFGAVVDGEIHLNPTGELVQAVWEGTGARFPCVELDEYILMPNHFHAIISFQPLDDVVDSVGTTPVGTTPVGATLVVARDTGAGTRPAPTPTHTPDHTPADTPDHTPDHTPADTPGHTPDHTPDDADPDTTPGRAPSLGDVIGAFKSITTHEIILAVRRGEMPPFAGKIWQRNYYEHIIRDDDELGRIRQYIRDNPRCWDEDAENPA